MNYLQQVLLEKINYQGSPTHLRRTLKQLGFRWKKTQTNRRILMERPDIIASRINYLRQVKRFREEGRTVVYTDETFIHSSHTTRLSWQSEDLSVLPPFSKGERLIIVHAGCEKGFINDASLVFKSKSATGDYHHEMNSENFMKWVKEKLLPNIPPNSVLVVDNAPYHNIQSNKCPTQSSRKDVIKEWLKRNGIQYNEDMLKVELLQLCKMNKPAPEYILDKVLKENGHQCLRLPAYHAELNPIELIWAKLKGDIARRNLTFKLRDVEQLVVEAFLSISEGYWQSCCEHVKAVERGYWEREIAIEEEIERFIIEIGSSEDETDTASECDDYSDTDTAEEF